MPPTRKIKKEKKAEVCRICLSAKDEKRVSLLADSELTRLLEYCIGICVKPENGSQVLCDGCSKKLKDYSDFKTLALKSDTLWNNVLSAEIKKDPAVTEIIHVKDEDDESIGSNHYTEVCVVGYRTYNPPNDDVDDDAKEYLEVDLMDRNDPEWVPNDEVKKQEQEDLKLDKLELKEDDVGDESAIKTKRTKNQSKGNKMSKDNLNGLSRAQFIKKFFEVTRFKKQVKYECLRCGDELTSRKLLPLHVQNCYESEVLIVKKPYDPDKAQRRQEAEKAPPSIFECGLCSFQNVDEEVVMKHVNEDHCLIEDLNCKLCDYVGRDLADVIVHRYKHMPQEFKYKYRCPTCNKVRLNELCLQFHYRSLHLKKAGGWCSFCYKTFTGYIYFRNHMRLHMEERYICDFCGQKFLFRNLIEAHIKEHMNVRNYICDTCGKTFKRNNALQGHIRAYHTVLKPVPCDHCNKQFKNAYSLKQHMKMVKKGNNFICDVCCKGYATHSLLKKHMFWHSGERPFSCESCGGKYKSKGNLKLHMRKHTGIYPYKCEACGKQFMTSTQLKAHSSVHTGVRRVKCLVCDRTFHEKRQMLAHCQSKHESYTIKYENHGTLAVTQGPQEANHNIM